MSVTVRLVKTEEKIWPSGEFCPEAITTPKKIIIIIAILEKLSGM